MKNSKPLSVRIAGWAGLGILVALLTALWFYSPQVLDRKALARVILALFAAFGFLCVWLLGTMAHRGRNLQGAALRQALYESPEFRELQLQAGPRLRVERGPMFHSDAGLLCEECNLMVAVLFCTTHGRLLCWGCDQAHDGAECIYKALTSPPYRRPPASKEAR